MAHSRYGLLLGRRSCQTTHVLILMSNEGEDLNAIAMSWVKSCHRPEMPFTKKNRKHTGSSYIITETLSVKKYPKANGSTFNACGKRWHCRMYNSYD